MAHSQLSSSIASPILVINNQLMISEFEDSVQNSPFRKPPNNNIDSDYDKNTPLRKKERSRTYTRK